MYRLPSTRYQQPKTMDDAMTTKARKKPSARLHVLMDSLVCGAGLKATRTHSAMIIPTNTSSDVMITARVMVMCAGNG